MKTIGIHGARASSPVRIDVIPTDFPSEEEIQEDAIKLISFFHSHLPFRTFSVIKTKLLKKELDDLLEYIKEQKKIAENHCIKSDFWCGRYEVLEEIEGQIKSLIKDESI